MASFYVYKHTHKTNGKVYIGITSQPPKNRWRKGEGYRECPYFYHAIKKYGWDAFRHEILYKNITKEEAEEKEIELISKFKSNDTKHGYNIANGGNCMGSMSKDTKNKISQTLKGRAFTEDHKRKIALAQTGSKNHMSGKKLSEEAKERIRQANIEHPSSGAFKSRKVNQYDLNGNYIKTWNCMGDIKRELGLSHCLISDCCRGYQKTSGGYIWKYYR